MTAATGRRDKTERYAVDLSPYPDLVVIYLAIRATSVRGVATILELVRPLERVAAARPDGLLLHEFLIHSLLPLQVGFRQYWRDFESLESWTRVGVHSRWWRDFLEDTRGTVLSHELYSRRGGMQGIEGVRGERRPRTTSRGPGVFTGPREGLFTFAPVRPARGPMFSARGRLGLDGTPPPPPVMQPEGSTGARRARARAVPVPGGTIDGREKVDAATAAAVAAACTRRVASLLRSGPQPDAPTTPGWTVRDTAAHLAAALRAYQAILRGEGSPVARLDDIGRWNAEQVGGNEEHDCAALAAQVEEALAVLPSPEPSTGSSPPVRWHGGLELPVATAWAVLAAEALVHGYDVATAAGKRWPMGNSDVTTTVLGLLPLLPHYVDAERVGTLRACFDVRLRSEGRPRAFFVFDAGRLAIEVTPSRPVDCHVSADPAALLLLAYGRAGPLRGALTGRIVAWGRKPWLAFTLGGAFRKP